MSAMNTSVRILIPFDGTEWLTGIGVEDALLLTTALPNHNEAPLLQSPKRDVAVLISKRARPVLKLWRKFARPSSYLGQYRDDH